MGRHTLEYPKEAINLVKRKGDRASYALKTIHSLINSAQLLNVSFNPPNSPFPTILPMIGQMGSFDRPSADLGDPLELYLHGYVSSRLFNTGRAATADSAQPEGMPVCIAASHVDGLVLALSAFSSSYNYRSAALFGYATIVEDDDEKLYAMELITDSVVPGRWANSRLPPTKGELQSTGILKVKITSGSAKFRDGGIHDEKYDMDNEEVVNSFWCGVLPVHQVIPEPLPGPYNKVEVPEYISEFVKDFNDESKETAISAAKKE